MLRDVRERDLGVDLVEDLHGHPVSDPYRWLEDPDATETVDWVSRQNEVTEAYLESLP